MRIVSLFGFSNSGKTTVAQAIVAEARRRDMRAAAMKIGHATVDATEAAHRDTDRIIAAGAEFAAYRSRSAWLVQIPDATPPPDRDGSVRIPPWLSCCLQHTDLLVIEGRRVEGALVVQTVGADGALKIPRDECDLVLENVPADPLPAELVELVFGTLNPEEEWMAGNSTNESRRAREISLKIDGREIELNGFVQDTFQEVVVGLVRSLGGENEQGTIEITVAGTHSATSR